MMYPWSTYGIWFSDGKGETIFRRCDKITFTEGVPVLCLEVYDEVPA